jgi:hypothetical protein
METPLNPISKCENTKIHSSRLRLIAIGGILLSFSLVLSSCSSTSPEQKANQALVENILNLGCNSWKKTPINTREVASTFANAANTYNEQHTDKKYDPLAMAAINWNLIDVTTETTADESLIKTFAGFTIIEFCKSGKVIDYGNS